MNVILVVDDERSSRRRVRTLDLDQVVGEAVAEVTRDGRPAVFAHHGGTVPNNYRYPAVIDGIVVVAIPHNGAVYAKAVAVNVAASSVTLAGVAASCGFNRAMFDGRYGCEARRAAHSATLVKVAAELGLCE